MGYEFTGPQGLGIAGAVATSTLPNSNPAALTSIYTSLPDGMFVGQVVEGKDPTNGYWGRFKLLYGVGSTVVGSLVFYDGATGLTTLATGANSARALAVAMAANTATTSLAWYQTEGVATVKKTAVTVNPNVLLYISGTAGRVKVIQSAGLQLIGVRTSNTATVTSTTSTVLITMGPGAVAQGQIT